MRPGAQERGFCPERCEIGIAGGDALVDPALSARRTLRVGSVRKMVPPDSARTHFASKRGRAVWSSKSPRAQSTLLRAFSYRSNPRSSVVGYHSVLCVVFFPPEPPPGTTV